MQMLILTVLGYQIYRQNRKTWLIKNIDNLVHCV